MFITARDLEWIGKEGPDGKTFGLTDLPAYKRALKEIPKRERDFKKKCFAERLIREVGKLKREFGV